MNTRMIYGKKHWNIKNIMDEITLIRGDINHVKGDAVVNAENNIHLGREINN